MDEKTVVNVKWLNDRFEDNLLRLYKSAALDMLTMSTSIFGYEEIDKLLGSTDKKKVKFNNTFLKNRFDNPSAMSVSGTIAVLSRQTGPFIIPPDIIDYMKEEIPDEQELDRYLKRFPDDEELWDKAKEYYEALIDSEFPNQSAYSLCGAFYTECTWKPNVVNVDEVANRNKNVQGGWADAGEGLFGLTFWRQKEKIIKKLGLDRGCDIYLWQRGGITKTKTSKGITLNKSLYNKGPAGGATVLAQCTEEVWMEILKAYIDGLNKAPGDDKKPLEYIMYDEEPVGSTDNEDDDHKLLYATYLFKAGNAYGTTYEGTVKRTNDYMRTHKDMYESRFPGFKPKNGFVEQLIAAWALSRYVADEIKVEDLADTVKKELFGY